MTTKAEEKAESEGYHKVLPAHACMHTHSAQLLTSSTRGSGCQPVLSF